MMDELNDGEVARVKDRVTNSGGSVVGLAGAVKSVVRTFMEQKHFRELHRMLSDAWSDSHSLSAAVRLMEAHGVKLTPAEEANLGQLPEDRRIDALVNRMPQQSREQFEHFFLQLSLIASTTTRLRVAMEAGEVQTIDEVLDSAENVGILGFILKMAVSQAGKEVRAKEKSYDDWLADTDSRMAPLLQSQAQAMISQKGLADAKAQLGIYQTDANDKSKKVLLTLVAGNQTQLVAMTFLGWAELLRKMKREAEIRREYADEIATAQKLLAEFKAKSLKNIKGVLMRNAESHKGTVIKQCYMALKQEAIDTADAEQTRKDAAELEEKLRTFADGAKSNAKGVLARMNAANDESLKGMCWSSWVSFVEDYKKNKEMNDAVKVAEQRLAQFKEKQNSSAKSVLNKMSQASGSALIQSCFAEWKEIYEDEKRMAAMSEHMGAQNSKFGSFAVKNKGTAMHEMLRMQLLGDHYSILACFAPWKRDTKVERMRRYGKEKNNKRKQQLMGVKGLFKDFSTKLDDNLSHGTPRVDLKNKDIKPLPRPPA